MVPFSLAVTAPVCSGQSLLHEAGEWRGCRDHGLPGDIFLTSVPLGYGGLGLSIEGPSKVDINCEDMEDGTCKVTYCPTEPGTYVINIKFADKHVPGEALGRDSVGTNLVTRQVTCGPDFSFLTDRKPLHREGDWRGPHEGEHHPAQTGTFHRHHW